MDAGTLRQRVTIQSKTITEDSLGQPIETWTDLVTLWANVKFENGAEYNRANRESNEVLASVRVRRRNDITHEMRVVYQNYLFNIISQPLLDSKGEFMDLPVSTREV